MFRHDEPEQEGIAQDHRSERKRVWAYRGQQDPGDGRVRERTTRREGIGRRARRGGDDDAVGLDDGEEVGVAVEFEVGDVRAGPAVEDEFVEDFEGGFGG